MISIKKVGKEELSDFIRYEEINTVIKECEDTTKICFAVIEGSFILGHAIVEIAGNLAPVIHELYIVPEERNKELEDGLLRTVLNYLRLNSFGRAIIKNKDSLEECDIEQFFSVKCKDRAQ